MRTWLVVILLALLVAPTHAGRKCIRPERISLTVTIVSDGNKAELANEIARHVKRQLSPRCFAPNVEHTVTMRLTFRRRAHRPAVKLQQPGGLESCFAAIDWSRFRAVKRGAVVELGVTAYD